MAAPVLDLDRRRFAGSRRGPRAALSPGGTAPPARRFRKRSPVARPWSYSSTRYAARVASSSRRSSSHASRRRRARAPEPGQGARVEIVSRSRGQVLWQTRRRPPAGAGSVVNRCGGGWSAVADAPSAPGRCNSPARCRARVAPQGRRSRLDSDHEGQANPKAPDPTSRKGRRMTLGAVEPGSPSPVEPPPEVRYERQSAASSPRACASSRALGLTEGRTRVRRVDDVRRRQATAQRPRQAQAIDREQLRQPFPEAGRRRRPLPLQPRRILLQLPDARRASFQPQNVDRACSCCSFGRWPSTFLNL